MRIDPNDPYFDLRKEMQDNLTAAMQAALTKGCAYGLAIAHLGAEADAFEATEAVGPAISAIALKWGRTLEEVVAHVRTLQAGHSAYVAAIPPMVAKAHDVANITGSDSIYEKIYETSTNAQMEILYHMWGYSPDIAGPPYDWSPPPVDEPETPPP